MCRLCSHISPAQKSYAGLLPKEGGFCSSSCSCGDTNASPVTLTSYSSPPKAAIPQPSGQRPVKLKNPPARGRSNFRTVFRPSEPFPRPRASANTTLLHNPPPQAAITSSPAGAGHHPPLNPHAAGVSIAAPWKICLIFLPIHGII